MGPAMCVLLQVADFSVHEEEQTDYPFWLFQMASVPSDAPRPRLCRVRKDYPEQDYGFNLHADRNKGQYIGAVDGDSPADRAGLQSGDRIVAVNGVGVQSETHKQVVTRIKEHVSECALLVIDEAGETWYRERNIQIPLEPEMSNGGGAVDKHSSNGQWNMTTPHSPSRSMRPRLCRMIKPNPQVEFGFNLHAEKNVGHFIGKVDKGSVAEKAGLEEGQRIVGVNGVLIYPSTPNREVVQIIKSDPAKTELLVAFPEVDQWYKNNHKEFSFDDAEMIDPVIGNVAELSLTKTSSPSPVAVENGFANYAEKTEPVTSSNASQPPDPDPEPEPEPEPVTVSVPVPKLPTEPKVEKNGPEVNNDDKQVTNVHQQSRSKSAHPPVVQNGGAEAHTRSQQQDWLNLSAAELRERVSRHKKVDPRNQQLTLLQKYEIIHNL